MPGWKPDRARILGEVVQSERARVVDQDAEDAAAVRGVADLRVHLRRDPVRDEALEAAPGGIDHTQGRVPCSGHPCGSLDDALEDAVERQLRVDRDPRL